MKIQTSFASHIGSMVASLACADKGKIIFSSDTRHEIIVKAEEMASNYADENGIAGEARHTFIRRTSFAAQSLLSMLEIPEDF